MKWLLNIKESSLWMGGISLRAVAVGALLALVDHSTSWWRSWFAYILLLVVAGSALYCVEKKLSLPSLIGNIAKSVFWLRLGLGVSLMLLLPILGYQDNQASLRGYLFQDAYNRDQKAWALASSDRSITDAFSANMQGDQYGGLLALSAATYRLLSPESHRPILVLVWITLAGALSVGIFWKAAHTWLHQTESNQGQPNGDKVALAATLIFSFYPETLFLGSSHMREAIVMLGIVIVFFGFVQLVKGTPGWYQSFGLGSLILLLFQPPLAFLTIGITFVLMILEPGIRFHWKYLAWFTGFAFLAVVIMVSIWQNLPSLASFSPLETVIQWLKLNFSFQTHLMERASGMLQKLLSSVGDRWALPVILGYGAVQPVLPAALVDPAAWIWRIINIFRAIGWYGLAPGLVYGMLVLIPPRRQNHRWQFAWLSLICIAWILVSAAAGGGDQWDNPRYRSLFLPWMALVAAWGWEESRSKCNPWLVRLWVAEAIFVLIFLEWYVSRYYPTWIHLDVRITIGLTLLVVIGFLGGSLGWDILRRKSKP